MLDLFEEFFKIIPAFNQAGVRYAVVGGVAMAFHVEPRFTKDIDFLVLPEDLNPVDSALQSLGYFESSVPWNFKSSNMTLHRFMKTEGEDFLIVDILIGNAPEHRKIIDEAVFDETAAGTVRLAGKEHLIRLKQARNSDQDQIDIRRLQDEQN